MDRLSKFLLASVFGGVITLCVGTTYIPQVGGLVPPDKSPEEFHLEQQKAVYTSPGFKATMVGVGITVVSLVALCIRLTIVEQEDLRKYNIGIRPRSILKVTRIMPSEQINITVEDPKPQVRTTPQLTSQIAPPLSSSPPIQLFPGKVANIIPVALPGPRGPVVRQLVPLVRTFKYPPPYDRMNKS